MSGVEQVTADREAAGAMVEDGVVVDKGILFHTSKASSLFISICYLMVEVERADLEYGA